ncbi:MAG: sulfotransferase family protein [Gammaproteobacteria bacterium]|nr:sulfotransferase family protein [Gammaproteobacteria bacterium]
MQVIGAGLGRTGTSSLKIALEMLLSGPCYHMFELFQRPDDVSTWQAAVDDEVVDWTDFFDGWVATVDWPAAPLFDKLSAAFPDALVLLSVRDGEDWYRSANETIFSVMRGAPDADANPMGKMVRAEFARWLTTDVDNKTETIAAFDRHNERVRSTVPADRLLEWRPGDGWEPICAALELTVPREPFPHTNAAGGFSETVAAAQAGKVERGYTPDN